MAPEGQEARTDGWAPRAAWAIVALFLLACVPLAVWQFFTVNFDEPRYTVAAAIMIATGDYIVPSNPWGGVRLLKPPLAYWYVVGGFSVFGQTLFGAKVLWLASAGAVLGLTWALARAVGASKAGAAVAVAALAANLHFARAALTHIPDMPMMLGLTLALVGFARILAAGRDRDAPAWAVYAAWMGIAWAFLAKGLLAFVLLALSLLMRAPLGLRRPRGHELAAILLAVAFGGWWYVAVAIREPEMLVQQFLGDQVTQKTSLDLARILETFGKNVLDLLQGFLPLFIAAVPFSVAALLRRPRREVAYMILWCVVVVVVFSFASQRTERYMLPAMPALAALIGLWFSHLTGAEIARRAGRTVRILLPVVAVVGLITAGVVYAGETVFAALAVLAGFALLVAVLWRLAGIGRPAVALTLLAILPPGAVLSVFPAWSYLGVPSITDLSLAAIEEAGAAPADVLVIRRWQLIERLGLREGPIEDYRFRRSLDPGVAEDARIVLTTRPEDAPVLEAMGYSVREVVGAPGGYPFGDLVGAILARDLPALRAAWGERLWIAQKAPPDGA